MEFLTDKQIGELIKKSRIYNNYTQAELGELIGVQAAAVQKWESGKVKNIKRDVLQKLAITLRISPANLIGISTVNTEIFNFSKEDLKKIDDLIVEIKKQKEE